MNALLPTRHPPRGSTSFPRFMARRASSSINPIWVLVVGIVVVAAIAGGMMLKGKVTDPFRTLPVFPIADYMQNSNSLRGNTYKLDGVIGDLRQYTTTARLFAVEVANEPVSLLVPAEFNHMDMRKGQRFLFKVEVADKGVLRAKDVKKE